ncbi:protein angel homolog 1 [Centroberyx affinis]|uniref:protein angel homolog 1 n=1 Tax=Centroberyx affinis TaxID=166261 RepID=UPI003A5C3869
MIGSLLFYGLYPLSRYFTNRSSEASKKGLPSAVVNGKAVWDGGGVPARRFTQSQTTLLDHRLSSSSGPRGQTGEGMKEQAGPGKEADTRPDMDKQQLKAVLPHEETKNEPILKKSEVQGAVEEKEAEMSDGKQKDKVEAPKEEDQEITIQLEELHMKQNMEDGTIAPTEKISPAQDLCKQLQCLSVEDGIAETTCPMEGERYIPSMEESVTPDQAAASATESWDEYIIADTDEMLAGASGPKLDLVSLLSDPHSEDSLVQSSQAGWHFPAGPGLADVVQCPLWQFPPVSYYNPLQPTLAFEVMWRVWEEGGESSTAAEPFQSFCPDKTAFFDFTVMSYNILAQDLLEANQGLYTHCSQEVLEWSYRCPLILEEILKWAPDILCLQEVQENHYNEHLHPVLLEMGYTCVYKRRTGTKTDGCVTCYRGDRFSERSVSLLEFFRPETELLDRDNVGVVLLLQPVVTQGSEVKAKGPPLCVANTHLLFNPRRGDVKLAQLAIVLAEIDSVMKSCEARGERCNVVLCGDFNSVPNMPLYQLITTGQLVYRGLGAWMISGQEDLSHKAYHRLFAPLWPSSLGITDNCQYTAGKETFESQRQQSGQRLKCHCVLFPVLGMYHICPSCVGKRQYNHDFLRRLRFCPAACVRPLDMELIPGVTDITPEASRENQPKVQRFRHTVSHGLDLQSAYTHILPGSGHSEVTTLHSEVGATVDYIFYSPKHDSTSDHKAGHLVSGGLKLIGRLSLLSEADLWSMNGLPNHIFPSDHLSLLAKFQLDLSVA